MLKQLQILGLALAVLATVCNASLYSSGDVVSLKTSNFDRLVKDSDQVWIVEFYAPWCGHCQSFASDYSKAATALKGIVGFVTTAFTNCMRRIALCVCCLLIYNL